MTTADIKSRLGIDDAEVRLSDNAGWFWVNITREHEGNRYVFTHRLPLAPSDEQIKDAWETIDQWWNETVAATR